jgi:DNA-binding MarR family transcriptional regulator
LETPNSPAKSSQLSQTLIPCRFTSNKLTPLLKRLENQRRIRRVSDPRDERQVRIRLTAAGRALGGDAAHIPRCILEASGLSAEDLGRLQRQITALHKALERYAESKPAPRDS